MERLIANGAGQGLPVVFDFDNTIVCGDIGEAVLAVLARSGRLLPAHIAKALCPPFRISPKRTVRMEHGADILEYYQAFLAPTVHGQADPTPLANGYVFATEVLDGLRLSQVVEATRSAYGMSRPGEVRWIEVTPGRTRFPAPFFYPQIVELIGALIHHEFQVWVLSASNVWSVRWMVLEGLNPLLRQRGFKRGLTPEQVIGISTLLTDATGRLYKDGVLVREDPDYAHLKSSRVKALRLTSRLQFPVPTYSGKLACIQDAIGRPPYLCVGDSPSDHAMLNYSQHRLWIARHEKPEYQRATRRLIKKTGPRGWICQTVCTREQPGFTPNHEPTRL